VSWHVLFPVECCNNSRFLVVVCILLSLDSSVLFFGVGLQDRFVTYPISYTMSTPYKDEKPGAEPDITITNAVPAGAAPTQHDGPPVPPGHARFYCEKCRTVSFLIHLASLLEEGRKLHQLQYGFSPSLVVSPSVCVYICLVFLSFFLSFFLSHLALRFARKCHLVEMRPLFDLQFDYPCRMSQLHHFVNQHHHECAVVCCRMNEWNQDGTRCRYVTV
jgi:hypothetical protein